MISNNVMKLNEWGESILYRVACQCSDPQCDLLIELCINEDDPSLGLTLHMYKDLTASSYSLDYCNSDFLEFFRVLWNKIKMCSKIIFKGYIKETGELIITSNKHVNAFIEALQEGSKKIRNGDDKNT